MMDPRALFAPHFRARLSRCLGVCLLLISGEFHVVSMSTG